MPEGEIDGVRERPVPEHNKSARRAVGLSRRRCERTHSDTDRGYTQFSMLWYVDTSMDPQDIYECVFLVATPDYEYGGRRIVGNTRLIRNGKSSCLGEGRHTVGEALAPVTSSWAVSIEAARRRIS
jgi:hypothetical protein